MYYSTKAKVENIVQIGKVGDQYIESEKQREAFNKWTDGFTPHDHPTVIQDFQSHQMPLRVSAIMTNAPIVLTQDCDMCSNDPQTARRALCYLSDPKIQSNLGYIQFPQRFNGLNKNDTYACEMKRSFQINPIGIDGLSGPIYIGTGYVFNRRVFFGGPSTFVVSEMPELSPKAIVDKPIQSQPVLAMAHHVAGCNYENETKWGSKQDSVVQMGFRYGSLLEDILTGYRLKCEGWRSIFCHPDRAAFYGHSPINLVDILNQSKRWAIGFLEVGFSKYSPTTFGAQAMGPLMGVAYAHYVFKPLWSIPTTIYAFLPQLAALLNGISIFPRVLDQWFLLYAFLFFGAYMQDFLDFFLAGGSVQSWWNDQKIWMVKGLSCLLFGLVEYLLKSLGISTQGFNLTSEVVDDEQRRRSGQGVFEFGVASPLFLPVTAAAIMNLNKLRLKMALQKGFLKGRCCGYPCCHDRAKMLIQQRKIRGAKMLV
ncbi:Cellulose synthase-like protein G2 [Morella rubra]|uniref:Cellulose synthase-like protein G2 n=1 Tax=Morella rubra TaxID=262757 RepID=A0A6A1VU08_9ROSI|nr:Cellulose synthase-like protein G2 [Morella rubra]